MSRSDWIDSIASFFAPPVFLIFAPPVAARVFVILGKAKDGPVVQWIEYLPAGRQGSFLNF
jgi:hypothetical protein